MLGKLTQYYASGRRLQADRSRHRGLWYQNVYVPVVVISSIVLFVPTVVTVYLLRSSGLSTDISTTLAVGLALPLGWILYYLLLGVRANRDGT
jgi:uncharacterized membrane protein YGL010W